METDYPERYKFSKHCFAVSQVNRGSLSLQFTVRGFGALMTITYEGVPDTDTKLLFFSVTFELVSIL